MSTLSQYLRTRSSQRLALSVFIAVLAMGWTFAVSAQPGGGRGPRLSDAELSAIWSIQAKGIAADLGLNDELTSKLDEAYAASRKSHHEAMASQGGGDGGGGRERWQAMLAVNKAESEKLGKALGAFLSEEQTKQALSTLGSFNRQWDRLVQTFAAFKLDGEKNQKGLTLIAKYVADSDSAREAAMAGGDFQGIREKMQALKTTLDEDLVAVLSSDQAAKWKEETAGRGPGGGGRGGDGGGRGRGGDGGGRSGGAVDPDGEQL